MLITNTETVPGREIVGFCGLVSGSTVRAKHAGRDILAGIKNIFGGELRSYTELLEESRVQATQRMWDQAVALGANAVVNVRFSTSSIAAGAAEIYVYGTAVLLSDDSIADAQTTAESQPSTDNIDLRESDLHPSPDPDLDLDPTQFAPPHMRDRPVDAVAPPDTPDTPDTTEATDLDLDVRGSEPDTTA